MTPRIVSVWGIDLDLPIRVVDGLRAYLDDDEVQRAVARRDDAVRNRYVVAHGALRSILAAHLGVEPDAVEISRRCARCGHPTHGRPELVAGGDVSFSLSHSGGVAMVAVVAGARVGIDVEVERPRSRLDALAARVLSASDYDEWQRVHPAAQLRAFLEHWTAKEAYLKALGAGIFLPLRDVPRDPEGWTIGPIASPPGSVAALAVEGTAVATVHEWTPPVVAARHPDYGQRPIDKFRGTAVGGVLAAGMLGLRDALEPPKEEKVAIVQDYAGDPPFKDPVVLRLDPDHPEDSIVMVRPWLRDPRADSPDA